MAKDNAILGFICVVFKKATTLFAKMIKFQSLQSEKNWLVTDSSSASIHFLLHYVLKVVTMNLFIDLGKTVISVSTKSRKRVDEIRVQTAILTILSILLPILVMRVRGSEDSLHHYKRTLLFTKYPSAIRIFNLRSRLKYWTTLLKEIHHTGTFTIPNVMDKLFPMLNYSYGEKEESLYWIDWLFLCFRNEIVFCEELTRICNWSSLKLRGNQHDSSFVLMLL